MIRWSHQHCNITAQYSHRGEGCPHCQNSRDPDQEPIGGRSLGTSHISGRSMDSIATRRSAWSAWSATRRQLGIGHWVGTLSAYGVRESQGGAETVRVRSLRIAEPLFPSRTFLSTGRGMLRLRVFLKGEQVLLSMLYIEPLLDKPVPVHPQAVRDLIKDRNY